MKTKRVLLATPLLEGADINYIRAMIRSLLYKFPGYEIDFQVCDTGSINFARNEIAWSAEQGGYDRLIQIDSDMGYTPENLARLLSFEEDYVAGVYCKRKPGRPHWLLELEPGAKELPNGLVPALRVATGFTNLKVSCLTKLREAFPEREFLCQNEGGPVETRMEWYPMGVYGPRTAQERLKKIQKRLLRYWDSRCEDAHDYIRDIETIIEEEYPPGTLYGEDYYFCEMMREAGFKIYADLGGPVIPHIGNIAFPITPDMVGFDPNSK